MKRRTACIFLIWSLLFCLIPGTLAAEGHTHTPGEEWCWGDDLEGRSKALHWKICTGCGQRVCCGVHTFGPWQHSFMRDYHTCLVCGLEEEKGSGRPMFYRPRFYGTPVGEGLQLHWESIPVGDEENCQGFVLLLYDKDYDYNKQGWRIELDADTRYYELPRRADYQRAALSQKILFDDGSVGPMDGWAEFWIRRVEGDYMRIWLDETAPDGRLRIAAENTAQQNWHTQAGLRVELICGLYDKDGRLLETVAADWRISTMRVADMDLPSPAGLHEIRVMILDPIHHTPIQEPTSFVV